MVLQFVRLLTSSSSGGTCGFRSARKANVQFPSTAVLLSEVNRLPLANDTIGLTFLVFHWFSGGPPVERARNMLALWRMTTHHIAAFNKVANFLLVLQLEFSQWRAARPPRTCKG